MDNDVFLPRIARIDAVRDETPDTKTFTLRFREPEDSKAFHFLPGQFVELSVFGYGEAPFCIASSPTRPETFETTIRRTGTLTDALHQLAAGAEVGVRGPFGNGFDVEGAGGKDLLFVAGGIGLPPLRSLIRNVLDQRDRFRNVTVLYGARTPAGSGLQGRTQAVGDGFGRRIPRDGGQRPARLDGKRGDGAGPVHEDDAAAGKHAGLRVRPADHDQVRRPGPVHARIQGGVRHLDAGTNDAMRNRQVQPLRDRPSVCMPGRSGFQLQADSGAGRVRLAAL